VLGNAKLTATGWSFEQLRLVDGQHKTWHMQTHFTMTPLLWESRHCECIGKDSDMYTTCNFMPKQGGHKVGEKNSPSFPGFSEVIIILFQRLLKQKFWQSSRGGSVWIFQFWFDSVFNLNYSVSVFLVSVFAHHHNARVF